MNPRELSSDKVTDEMVGNWILCRSSSVRGFFLFRFASVFCFSVSWLVVWMSELKMDRYSFGALTAK